MTDTGGLLLVYWVRLLLLGQGEQDRLVQTFFDGLEKERDSYLGTKISESLLPRNEMPESLCKKKDANMVSPTHGAVVTNVFSQTIIMGVSEYLAYIYNSSSKTGQSSMLCVTNIRMENILQRTLEVSRMLI